MDRELLVGVLLIIVGLAVGLIAVALVMNRRAERDELQANEPDPQEPVGEGLPGPDVVVATQTDEGPEPESPSIPPALHSSSSAEKQLVAEIYRERSSGALIVRAADQEFRSPSQIEDEQLRMELSALASDLSSWFGEGLRISAAPSAPRPAARPGSRSMLEGINSILQRALAAAGDKAKGVQLIPDAAGGVKVLIGVKSYALDEVPDEDIKRLIRESVAEWEAGQ